MPLRLFKVAALLSLKPITLISVRLNRRGKLQRMLGKVAVCVVNDQQTSRRLPGRRFPFIGLPVNGLGDSRSHVCTVVPNPRQRIALFLLLFVVTERRTHSS